MSRITRFQLFLFYLFTRGVFTIHIYTYPYIYISTLSPYLLYFFHNFLFFYFSFKERFIQ